MAVLALSFHQLLALEGARSAPGPSALHGIMLNAMMARFEEAERVELEKIEKRRARKVKREAKAIAAEMGLAKSSKSQKRRL